jgi:spermidine/putrescine ABC transporter ATP-binding subunit
MTLSSNDNILELRSLSKYYGDVLAVNDISLGIGDGEFLTVLGPSGSGKTTVLLMIAGFEYPSQGEIIFKGKSISFVPPDKRDIGMVFQNYALFPHMNLFDNIAFPLKMRKVEKQEIKRKVAEALELVQLSGYERRTPKQLSGGQQQRIALARAVVFNPAVLLMDEPLGALDKKLREHMQLEIKHIQSKLKRTVIYVTHDQEEALVMSDRIVVMNEGIIQQVGTPNELYEKPNNKFVAGFIGESNFIEGSVVEKNDDILTILMKDQSKQRLKYQGNIIVGEVVRFSIRPEKIFITKEQDNSVDFLEGVIKEVIYVGETTRYKIMIGNQGIINLKEMNTLEGGSKKVGEKVKISWDKKNLIKI